MRQTITEKILAAHAGVETCKPGDILQCHPALVMGHDLTVPHALNIFGEIGAKKIYDPSKLVFVQDHFQPAKDIRSAGLAKTMRKFAREHGIKNYFEVGWGGICHSLLLEKVLALPGMLIVGADSHTLTCGAVGAVGYGIGATDLAALMALGEVWIEVPHVKKIVLENMPPRFIGGKDIALKILSILGQEGAINQSIEYTGNALEFLAINDRVTLTNMSAETGAVCAIIHPDSIIGEWLKRRTTHVLTPVLADPDAHYRSTQKIDVSALDVMVAAPDCPSNVVPVRDVSDVEVDQVFLGSCTNGSIEDLRRFAAVLGEHKFSHRIRVIITPATQETYIQALREGIIQKFSEAGGAVQSPSCGPCIGGHGGVLAAGEVCLSTTNRNFKGRMGHPDSRVYLGSPEVAAATAVTGRLTHPAEVAGKEPKPHL